MSESKLLKSMLLGALVGGAISMLDRKTREHAMETTKKVKDSIVYYAKNKEELQQLIEEKMEVVQTVYETATDNVSEMVNKFEEVKEIPSTIQNMVNDTKQALSNNDDPVN